MAYHLDDTELYYFNEGLSTAAYQTLGCHSRTDGDGNHVYRFAVWAPEAMAVSIVGDFNGWDPEADPMHLVGTTGVWEGFLGFAQEGQFYKYAIWTAGGALIYKADPYAVRQEPHGTASVVAELPAFAWTDGEYLKNVPDARDVPVCIYEVHAGSWKKGYTYRDLAGELVDYCVDMGYTHIEFMPLTEYPYDPSLGYQTTGYYAPTARYGTPEDLMYFINRAHEKGIGVLMDWVPAYFPMDDHGLAFFDGSCCYEHFDVRRRETTEWGTSLFNFSRTQVHSFLLSSAVFWLQEYHLDGLHVEGVSHMIYRNFGKENGDWMPNRYGGPEDTGAITFLRKVNHVAAQMPGNKIMIATESTGFQHVTGPVKDGGLGFTFTWNLGWRDATLAHLKMDSFLRKFHYNQLTDPMRQAFVEEHVLPLPHMDVSSGHGSVSDAFPGDEDQRMAQQRLLYAYQYVMPGKKLTFMGCELSQNTEWRFDESLHWELLNDPKHRGVQDMMRELNRIYAGMPTIHEVEDSFRGFTWLQADDSRHSVIAFQRMDRMGHVLVCLFNFSPTPWHGYSVGVNAGGLYHEVFNSDATAYGGSGQCMNGDVETVEAPLGAHRDRLCVDLPPFGAVYMAFDGILEPDDGYYYDFRG